MKNVVFYKDSNGVEPARLWLDSLKDKVSRARISVRILRLEQGNFGDHKSLGEGLWEMRFTFGPGYRLYYSIIGSKVVLLLMGGDKSSQRHDISVARQMLVAHKKEGSNG